MKLSKHNLLTFISFSFGVIFRYFIATPWANFMVLFTAEFLDNFHRLRRMPSSVGYARLDSSPILVVRGSISPQLTSPGVDFTKS